MRPRIRSDLSPDKTPTTTVRVDPSLLSFTNTPEPELPRATSQSFQIRPPVTLSARHLEIQRLLGALSPGNPVKAK